MRNIEESKSKFDECIAFLRGRGPRVQNIQERRDRFDECIAFLRGRSPRMRNIHQTRSKFSGQTYIAQRLRGDKEVVPGAA